MTKPSPINGLYHFAFPCTDAEETRAFYEDLLGMPLVHVSTEDRVPSTGEEGPFAHLFFQMADNSYLAFFDPNGLRLEINARTEPEGLIEKAETDAHALLAEWTRAKAERLART